MRFQSFKPLALAAGLILASHSIPSLAEGCTAPEFANQQRDAETVQKLETAFTAAFLKGDTDFEKCLLLPNYAEVSRSGKWRELSDELAGTARNQGKNLSVPQLPKVDVLLHGDVAVAHGLFTFTAPDGKSQSTRFSDVYVWKDGAWHVLYSQQTPSDN
ncbi:MAG TPA: nuclear transport factor 2 family protein [Alloacidobacterium sp.]|nr:nuclear transport factor 2 family protein [Alloacidobacterium sp.]